MVEVPGSMITGLTFCCWIFLFLSSNARSAIIANLVYFVKNYCDVATNLVPDYIHPVDTTRNSD